MKQQTRNRCNQDIALHCKPTFYLGFDLTVTLRKDNSAATLVPAGDLLKASRIMRNSLVNLHIEEAMLLFPI